MSYPYTTSQRASEPTSLSPINEVLREAGLVDTRTGTLTRSVNEIALALGMGLRQMEWTDPWDEPFALMIRADWCSIDGTEPGDLQMRVTPNGVQIRERTPSTLACRHVSHFSQTCNNCWTTRVLNPAPQWYPVSERVQVRLETITDNATTCRVEVRRRTHPNHIQPEAIWSEPWEVPKNYTTEFYKAHHDDRNIDTTWVDVAPDVQVSEGHTFPRGVLVRQATGREDVPWTTPRFIPETYWHWVALLPDGSMQLRCWRPRDEERNFAGYRIEVRQHVGRKPAFVAEPTWGKSKSCHFAERPIQSNGYALTLLKDRHRSYGYRGVEGLKVVTPQGKTIEILDTGRDIWVTPDLLVHPSYQGHFSWRHAVIEPEAAPTQWTMPEGRLLRTKEWTHLSDSVRAKLARRGRGVRVEVLVGTATRRHWWSRPSLWMPQGVKSFDTAHHLGDTIRVTFRPDQMAEIQHIVPMAPEQ